MRAYQKFTKRLIWVSAIVALLAGGYFVAKAISADITKGREQRLAALEIEEAQAKTWEAYTRMCLEAKGRIVKIDGLEACYKLDLVPRDLVHQSFWNDEYQECKKIITAVYVREDGGDGIDGCFYFELLTFEGDSI